MGKKVKIDATHNCFVNTKVGFSIVHMTPLQILAPIRIELTYDIFKGLRHSNVHIDQHMEHQNGGFKENLRAARGKSFSLQNLSYLRVL